MSTLRVDTITNNGSAVDLPQKFKVGGNAVEQGYTSSGTEPSSPSIGDFWWDSVNSKLYRYIDGAFKELSFPTGGSASTNGWYNRQTLTGITSATGSSSYPFNMAVTSDSSGNIYTVGKDAGRNTSFYSKFDTDGAHQWTKVWGNNVYYARASHIEVDSSGSNVFLFGHDYGQGENFNSDQPPDPQIAIIMKVSAADGSVVDTKWFQWNTISSNQAYTNIEDATIDSNDNLWCVYQGSASYGGASSNDITVFKLNSSLALQNVWRIQSSQNYPQVAYGINADSDDNIYITGIATGAASGAAHSLVMKLNNSGVLQWTKIFGGGSVTNSGYDRIYTQPVFDSNKDVYVGGVHRVGAGSTYPPYVAKLNATNGNIEWGKVWSAATTSSYGTFNIAIHNDVIYALAEGDSSLNDSVIAQFDTSGTMTSAHQVRTSGESWNHETSDQLNTDSNGNLLYASTSFSGSTYKASLVKFPATISAGTYGDLTIADKSTTTTNTSFNTYTHTSFSVSDITSSFNMASFISGTYGNPATLQTISSITNDLDAITVASGGGGSSPSIAWGGDRGFTIGGEPSSGGRSNTIEYCDITTLGNNTDFGDLNTACYEGAAVSNSTRILVSHGHPSSNNYVNSVDYFGTASAGNASDFGDLLSSKSDSMPCADGTKGIFMGGSTAYNVHVATIDTFTVANTGNATDFGDLTTNATSGGSSNDATRGIRFSGNQSYPSTKSNVIDYITMASASNATDFGDPLATMANGTTGVVSDNTKGVVGGGFQGSGSESNVLQYITIQTTANAQDFGDLLTTVRGIGATSNGSRGIFMGGYTGSAYINHIQYITIATPGNATDFGDIIPATNYDPCGASGAAS